MEFVETDALRIHRALNEIARLGRVISLQCMEAGFAICGDFKTDGALGLLIRLRDHEALDLVESGLPLPLEAAASGPGGMLSFSIGTSTVSPDGLLTAPWPKRLVCMQSRRHLRLSGFAQRRRRAELERPSKGVGEPLLDLSEEGVGLEVPTQTWPEHGLLNDVTLRLDDQLIRLPLLEVVHCRSGSAAGLSVVGARFVGMPPAQALAVRRWIADTQAAPMV
jgi:hypothetical protein